MDSLTFLPGDRDAEIDAVCAEWNETPYRHGKSLKGLGVDCIHFAAELLDRLCSRRLSSTLKSLPLDACVHNREGVEAAARWFLRNYPLEEVSQPVTAGDILVGAIEAPSHLMVVGDRRLWHATPPRVGFTGLQLPMNVYLRSIYRIRQC